MRLLTVLTLASMGAALPAASALADTIRVDADASIQAAVDAAASGDTIVIARGTFTGSVTVSGKTDLTIIAHHATLDASGDAQAALTIENSTNVKVQGLTIDAGAGGGVDITGSSGVRLMRNTIQGGAGAGITADASADLRIEHNTIAQTGGAAISVDLGLAAQGDVRIFANRTTDCGGSAAIVVDGGADTTANVTVKANRLALCGGDGIGVSLDATANGALVLANRVLGCGGDGINVDGGADGRVTGNVVMNTGDDGIEVAATGTLVARNRISLCADDALVISAESATVSGNRVDGAAGDGVEVDGTGNTVSGNHIEGAAEAGVQLDVTASGNVVSHNTCDDGGDTAVDDQSVLGANVLVNGGVKLLPAKR